MARYLLIEVEDNETAGDLVKALQADGEVHFYHRRTSDASGEAEYTVKSVVATVRALFGKPTQFCECPPSDKSVRGKKFGWWVHAECGKPKRGQCQHPRNLLDPEDLARTKQSELLYLGVTEGKNW